MEKGFLGRVPHPTGRLLLPMSSQKVLSKSDGCVRCGIFTLVF